MAIEYWIAAQMVDKLCARNLIRRRINSTEREMMIADIQQTYVTCDQRILYEVFMDWINQGHDIPQPADLIPRVRAIERSSKKGSGLNKLTPEQITECRQLCISHNVNGRGYLELVIEDDTGNRAPTIRGSYEAFRKRLVAALEDGRLN